MMDFNLTIYRTFHAHFLPKTSKLTFIMRSKRFISAMTIALLCMSMSKHIHSQILISLLFGDELNSDKVKSDWTGAEFSTI